MTTFRQRLRADFPRGWFSSPAWWWGGLREIGLRLVITLCAAALIIRVGRALWSGGDPEKLRRDDQLLDAWGGGSLVSGTGIGLIASIAIPFDRSPIPPVLACVLVAILTVNLLASALMVVVLLRSRLDRRKTQSWATIDFIDDHAPRDGRPPETIEEYRALQMQGVDSRDPRQ